MWLFEKMAKCLVNPRRSLAAITVLLALLVAALPFIQPASARQDDQRLDTTLTGQEIRVTGPNFALDDIALEEYPHGQGERIYISSVNTRAFAEIAFFDDSDTPEQTINVMMADFESTAHQFAIVDSGINGSIFYALAWFQLSDEFSGYFYIEVAEDVDGTTDLAQSLYVINDDFWQQLQIASSEITLSNNAFLGETVIDVREAIADYESELASTPQATPGPEDYSYEWVDSTVTVVPPLSLDWNAKDEQLESVYISSDIAFAYAGYLNLPDSTPEDALRFIMEGDRGGGAAPILLESEGSGERIWAVYRIPVDGAYTIMVIELNVASGDLWQVEALAAPEADVLAEVVKFQEAVTIESEGFLDTTSVDQLETILDTNRP